MKNDNPIGIFDSGMGGLTVLKAVRECLPEENIIYFGDTAHLPYGNKSPEAIIRFSLDIAQFFKRERVKLMVVACNTASVYSIKALKEKMDIPVVGVVESGVNASLEAAKSSIGVIGTYGTVKSGVYEEKIKSRDPGIKIYSKPCPLFVPLVEEGWTEHPVTREIVEIYLKDMKDDVDTLILACTHYPLLKGVISEYLGGNTAIIDSAMEVAKSVGKKIDEFDIANTGDSGQKTEFYVSDAPELFKETGRIFLEHEIEKVDMLEVE